MRIFFLILGVVLLLTGCAASPISVNTSKPSASPNSASVGNNIQVGGDIQIQGGYRSY